jgi:hypothetical protein
MSKPKKLQIRNSTAEFLVFTSQAGEKGIEVRVEDETVWLTQKLIGVLFEKGRSTITEHLQNIFETGELAEKAVCRDFRHTAEDGKDYLTAFYNLDAIIARLERLKNRGVEDAIAGVCMNPAWKKGRKCYYFFVKIYH